MRHIHAPSSSRNRTRPYWSKLHFETLESRQLLTVTAIFMNGTLTVTGDSGVEDIVITADGSDHTLINGLEPDT
jgi:hypothetical protein